MTEVSPLQEIESAVQDRARQTPGGELAPGVLRSYIEDEVARWSDDHKRGRRAFDLADPSTVVERAWRNLAGYGPLDPLLG